MYIYIYISTYQNGSLCTGGNYLIIRKNLDGTYKGRVTLEGLIAGFSGDIPIFDGFIATGGNNIVVGVVESNTVHNLLVSFKLALFSKISKYSTQSSSPHRAW